MLRFQYETHEDLIGLMTVALGCNRDDGSTFGFGGNPVPFDTAYYIDESDDELGFNDTSGAVDTSRQWFARTKRETRVSSQLGTVLTGDTAYNLRA